MANSFERDYGSPKFYRDDSNTPKKSQSRNPEDVNNNTPVSPDDQNRRVFIVTNITTNGETKTIVGMQFPIYLH